MGLTLLAEPPSNEVISPVNPSAIINSISRRFDMEVPSVKISELFEQCLPSLELLSHVAPENTLITTSERHFRQWGHDLFEGPAAVDAILGDDSGAGENLRSVLIRALVFIAVIEGKS
jgi:hypothetical protein